MFVPSSKALQIAALAASIALLAGAGEASAATGARHHPRRAEVNHRFAHQSHQIQRELREGEINRGQAHALHKQDRAMRREKSFMASQHGGHLTSAEQQALNQQENGINRKLAQ